MQFDVNTVNKILNIDDAYKAPDTLLALMLDKIQRENIFKKFLNVSTDLSFDWFHEYFEDEQAERKSKKQDFTPDSIATLLNKLTGNTTSYYYEPTAGTGGILITRWWQDCLNDPVGTKNNTNIPGISFFTYDPRKYWYQVEELSDRAVPFLIFNMAIRGMNGVAIQCDSLSREAKNAYFIRNNTDNALTFSEVIEVPKTKDFEKELNINWKEV